ncbi:Thioredoxin domain-containing protein 3 [Chytriomyces hyalinus]|nr:Thioredoxin domain-containing protein 3 [Chytriomyces hyalinus]
MSMRRSRKSVAGTASPHKQSAEGNALEASGSTRKSLSRTGFFRTLGNCLFATPRTLTVLVPALTALLVYYLLQSDVVAPDIQQPQTNLESHTVDNCCFPPGFQLPSTIHTSLMAEHGKKGEPAAPVLASSDEEFVALLSKPNQLRVMDVYSKFAGPCEPMAAIFKRLKQENGDKIAFVQGVSDYISCLEGFRNHSCPTFMFFYNRILVKIIRGANAPLIERTIKEQIELHNNNEPHRQIMLDSTTQPIASLLAPDAPLQDTAPQESDDKSKPSNESIPSAVHKAPSRASVTESSFNIPTTTPLNDPETAEHTLALLKPDAMMPSILENVIALLHHHRFDVMQVKKLWLNREQANELYKEAEGKDYFGRLIDYVTCAPVLALDLAKEGGIDAWRDVVGPRDPKDARSDAPKSLRGLYGQDRLMNSFHASDGPVSAARELAYIFNSDTPFNEMEFTPPSNPKSSQSNGLPQKTLAVIKPEAMAMEKIDQIIARIVARGYQVVKKDEGLINVERAQELSVEFLETPMFEESVQALMSGPVLSLMLKGENVIEGWMEMLGPSDPDDARRLFPMSLRAQYGLTLTTNGVHGSQTMDVAIQQLQSFFPHYLNTSASRTSIFKTPMGSLQASRAGSKAHLASSALRASVDMLETQRNAMKAAHTANAAIELPPPVQRTLALIKPDVYPDKKDAIMEMIRADGFTVIEEREVQFDMQKAEEFYKEHAEKGFYGELTAWMSSGPIYAMVLEKNEGIKAWRALAGPTNSNKAREESPSSVRATFGTDGTHNAVHGSDSPASATREIGIVFGTEISSVPERQRTLALVKPDVYPAKKEEIIAKIKLDGFKIVKESEVQFTKEKAQEFYHEHEGKGFYEELTTWMSSAPIYAMVLEKEAGVKAWRNLAGPTNSNTARETAAYSLRAMFGTDGSLNAVHGSDSPTSAAREIHVVFGDEVSPEATSSPRASEAKPQHNSGLGKIASVVALPVQLPPPVQRTLALIKPDVYPDKKDAIMEMICADGFTVIEEREVQFDMQKAEEFYKEHAEKGFYGELTAWMSSGPIYAMVLEKNEGIKAWRALAGPTNSNKAREESPSSVRATFGTDGTHNAVHGSDSPASAMREIGIVFGTEVSSVPERQRTLALIKPDVYPAKKEEIIAKIKLDGFKIVKESEVQFTKEKAQEFYHEHEGKGFYEELTTWMSSAPIYAMVLEKEAGVKAWRNLAGPTNSNTARETAAYSLRAMFGTDGSLNAVHGSDSPTSASREIHVVFGDEVSPVADGASHDATKVKSIPASKAVSNSASRAMSAAKSNDGHDANAVKSKGVSKVASQAGISNPGTRITSAAGVGASAAKFSSGSKVVSKVASKTEISQAASRIASASAVAENTSSPHTTANTKPSSKVASKVASKVVTAAGSRAASAQVMPADASPAADA